MNKESQENDKLKEEQQDQPQVIKSVETSADTVAQPAQVTAKEASGKNKKEPYKKGKSSGRERSASTTPVESEFMEKVISINRITKVTKGGKKLSFSALVVVGDTKGNVGYSLSKAAEVSIAIRKAMAVAKKNMTPIPMEGSTIPHEIIGQCGGARVLLKPASAGTGVIASGPVRAICDGAGIHNILTKCHRSNNPINVVKATMNGLLRLKSRVKKEVLEDASA